MAVALSVIGLAAASAQAKALHVTGQQTTITPSTQATQFLTSHNVTISALGAATIANGAVRLPISGGIVGPKGHNGVLLHKGGVKFTSGAHLLSVRGFVLTRIDNRTLLSAIAGGKRLVLARVTKVSETTTGTQTVITGELSLSAAAARAINHLLGQHVVSAGVDLGSLKSTVTVA